MPQLTLQPDGKPSHIWVTLDGQRLVCLRNDDREGLKVITTWLVDGQVISAEEAAAMQGMTPRTIEAYQAGYVRQDGEQRRPDGPAALQPRATDGLPDGTAQARVDPPSHAEPGAGGGEQ